MSRDATGDRPQPAPDSGVARHAEAVVPAVGRGRGALIVHCDAAAAGTRLTLSAGGGGLRRSRAVTPAELCGRPVTAAVFGDVPKGVYSLWSDGRVQRREVVIYGNHTTQIDLVLDPGPGATAPVWAGEFALGHHPSL